AVVCAPASLAGATRPTPRRPEELDSLWKDLAGEDTAKAYRAVWALAASPGQAVALVRQRLPAAGAPSGAGAARLPRLLADLDHKDFRRREKATAELGKMGNEA